jgi:hypothetical protein
MHPCYGGESHAIACCVPSKCNTCGVPLEKSYATTCWKCQCAAADAREEAKKAKAKRIHYGDYTTYPGYVYYNDEYEDLDTWLDDPDAPDEVWGVMEHHTPPIDAQNILENLFDEHYEGAIDHVDVDGLQKALDEWHAKNLDCKGFIVDESVLVWRESAEETDENHLQEET